MCADFARANTFSDGATVTAAGHNQNWAGVETWLNDRIGDDTAGKLVICNASGIPVTQALTNASMSSAGALTGVTDTALASPNNSVYKTLTFAGGYIGGKTTGTYYFAVNTSPILQATGSSTASGATFPLGFIYFDNADVTVTSKTEKLRIRQQVVVGSTDPSTVTLNCGLYPVTISAGTWTLDTVVADSATSTTGLATNTISSFTSASGDFTVPADGAYCLGVVVGSITCPAGINISAQLQTRNV